MPYQLETCHFFIRRLFVQLFDVTPTVFFDRKFLAREAFFLLKDHRTGRIRKLHNVTAKIRIEKECKSTFGRSRLDAIQGRVGEPIRTTKRVQEALPSRRVAGIEHLAFRIGRLWFWNKVKIAHGGREAEIHHREVHPQVRVGWRAHDSTRILDN